jgi:CHAT domain
MGSPTPRFPPGFDRRHDLQLEFSSSGDELESVSLGGARELEDGALEEASTLLGRLPADHRAALEQWWDAEQDPCCLVVRQSPTQASDRPWEQLPMVSQGKVQLVRCFQGLTPPPPKPPGEQLQALIVIGDARQKEGTSGTSPDIIPLVRSLHEDLQAAGLGSVTVAAPGHWGDHVTGEFEAFENPEDLLAILDRGWDVVHIVAHGTEPTPETSAIVDARELKLERGSLSIEDLANTLADGRTQLLTLQACWGGPVVAEALLAAVPHVIVFRKKVENGFSSEWAREFYNGLFQDRLSVAAAVARARGKTSALQSWNPAHFAADLKRGVIRDGQDYQRERYLGDLRARYADLGGLVSQNFGAGDHVSELYVELRLDRTGGQPLARAERPTLLSLLKLAPNQGVTGRWVLTGHPGTGKSTSLRALAVLLSHERQFVPILINLPDWPRRSDGKLEPFEAGLGSYANHCPPPTQGQRVVLIDGLDECTVADEQIKDFLAPIQAARLLVATRKLHFSGRIPSDLRQVDLAELVPEQQSDLLKGWFKADRRQHPERWGQRDPEDEAAGCWGACAVP